MKDCGGSEVSLMDPNSQDEKGFLVLPKVITAEKRSCRTSAQQLIFSLGRAVAVGRG